MTTSLTATSADGTEVRAYDGGEGPAIVIVGPGLDDGTRTAKLAGLLTPRFRVVRVIRRQYRVDLTEGRPFSVAQEVEDIRAIVRAIGGPVLLYGHSSGGVVALEALLAEPAAFAGAVVFEPASEIPGLPLGGTEPLDRTRPARSMTAFMRDVIGLPPIVASLVGLMVAVHPRYRRLAPCQIDDLAAMKEVGVRVEEYASIAVPTVLLYGDRSLGHIVQRAEAIHRAIPGAEVTVMPGRDHGADLKAPREVAEVVETLATRVLAR